MKKEIRSLIRELRKQGFTIRTTKRGHHLIYRDDAVIAGIPGTPSDHRSLKNSLAALRRGGFTGNLTS